MGSHIYGTTVCIVFTSIGISEAIIKPALAGDRRCYRSGSDDEEAAIVKV